LDNHFGQEDQTMFTDELRKSVWEDIRQRELATFASILTPQVLRLAAERAEVRIGRGVLNTLTLLWLALSSALHPGLNFCRVLHLTMKLLADMGELPQRRRMVRTGHRGGRRGGKRGKRRLGRRSRHDPRTSDPTALSEEAFVQARRLLPQRYWVALILLLGEIFEQRHGELVRFNGFGLLALDGTCITLPRQELGKHFGYARNRKGRRAVPQARLVMLQLPLVRLPWRYELTPKTQGESTVAARLLKELRRDDLVLMDRGFFHFNLFQQIEQSGACFAIRRIKRLRLRTIKSLGHKDQLVTWKPAARRWGGASMKLRMIGYQIKGFRASWIVTNVLDPRRISRQEFVGLADSQAWQSEQEAGLYHRRWEIETTFRELKRVQQMHKLRGRTPATIEFEVAGHVLLYLLVRWLMVEAAKRAGKPVLRLSFTEALAEVHRTAGALPICPRRRWPNLLRRMLDRIASHQVPWRPGRHYPRPNDGKIRCTGAGHQLLPSKLAA
jgi:transposase